MRLTPPSILEISLRRLDIANQVQRKGYRNKPLSPEEVHRNARITQGERAFMTSMY